MYDYFLNPFQNDLKIQYKTEGNFVILSSVKTKVKSKWD